MLDNLIAFRVLYMLVTPFKDTQAFKLGIIDEEGKLLKRPNTSEEKDAYSMLTRLVFNLKRLLIKLPGGDAKLKNIAAAYFLIKENINNKNVTIEVLEESLDKILNKDVVLVEETLTVMNFLSIFEEVPANATGPMVSTDEPVVRPKKKKTRIPQFSRSQLKV